MSRCVDEALGCRRRHPHWDTEFGRWIADFGPDRIVRELGKDPELRITQHTVYDWLRGHSPRPERAMALVEISDGCLTLEMVYGHQSAVRNQLSSTTRAAESEKR